MKIADIYQTLENRQNEEAVLKNGPFFCSERDSHGKMKRGIQEPWLGEGYYFWDNRIDDARWWGEINYKTCGYIICKTQYDQHSPLLYDMVGDVKQFDEFVECAEFIKRQRKLKRVGFSTVIKALKKDSDFKYKAIRVWPTPEKISITFIRFPKDGIMLGKLAKIQICFFDKTLLTNPYTIVEKSVSLENQTI